MTIRHSTCGLLAFYNNTKVDLFFSWLRFKHTMENPEKRRIRKKMIFLRKIKKKNHLELMTVFGLCWNQSINGRSHNQLNSLLKGNLPLHLCERSRRKFTIQHHYIIKHTGSERKESKQKGSIIYLTLRVNIIQNVRQTMQRICIWMLGVKSFKNWERKGSGFELNLVPRV